MCASTRGGGLVRKEERTHVASIRTVLGSARLHATQRSRCPYLIPRNLTSRRSLSAGSRLLAPKGTFSLRTEPRSDPQTVPAQLIDAGLTPQVRGADRRVGRVDMIPRLSSSGGCVGPSPSKKSNTRRTLKAGSRTSKGLADTSYSVLPAQS